MHVIMGCYIHSWYSVVIKKVSKAQLPKYEGWLFLLTSFMKLCLSFIICKIGIIIEFIYRIGARISKDTENHDRHIVNKHRWSVRKLSWTWPKQCKGKPIFSVSFQDYQWRFQRLKVFWFPNLFCGLMKWLTLHKSTQTIYMHTFCIKLLDAQRPLAFIHGLG